MAGYELQEKTLNVDGLNIAYTDIGSEDGHLVFCVHGLLSVGRDFDFLGHELAAQGYRCIAIDLPGRGKSDSFNHYQQYVPPSYLPYCQAVLEHEAAGQEFSWLGVSLGGILGMMLYEALAPEEMLGKEPEEAPDRGDASRGHFMANKAVPKDAPASIFPQFRKSVADSSDVPESAEAVPTQTSARMAHLILYDIGAEIPKEGLERVAHLAREPMVFDNFDAAVESLKDRRVAWGIESDEVWEHFIEHTIFEQEDGTYAMRLDEGIGMAQPEEVQAVALWHLWDKIKQPVHLVRGGQSLILPEDVAEEMQERYSGKRFTEDLYPDCGHVPNVMEPENIAALLERIKEMRGELTNSVKRSFDLN